VKASLNFLLGTCFFLKCAFIVPFVPKALLHVASVQRIVFGAWTARKCAFIVPIVPKALLQVASVQRIVFGAWTAVSTWSTYAK
jgi:hypothetical protein